MDRIDTVVIGAGVVGLAVGRALALAGHQVMVLEKESEFGTGISSRNSEVIHAGLYYPSGSLKAKTCVRGKALLYDFLNARNLPYKRCGKFIVATHEDQVSKLEAISSHARNAGVEDLEWWTPESVKAVEPQVSCVAALWSPTTGIIDSHAYMLGLLGELEAFGGMLVKQVSVERIEILAQGGFRVLTGGADPYEFECRQLVNCAGLGAQAVAGKMDGLDPAFVPPLYYSRGAYFILSGAGVFSRLIYPVPEPGGLGVHVTIDLAGQVRFGPDVEWIDSENYQLDATRSQSFYEAIRRYFPALGEGMILPGYTGIRPKLRAQGQGDADFMISGPQTHKVEGLVNMFGIESPGLTASLALAEEVVEALKG